MLLASAAAAQTYTITDLGALNGFTSSYADDNNNTGLIVGCSDNSVPPAVPCATSSIPWDAFLWSNGVMEDLHNLPGNDQSLAYEVNDAGVVVGYSGNSQTQNGHGFYWTTTSGMVDLGTLTGPSGWSIAEAITSKGVIVGSSYINNRDDAVFWTQSGGVFLIHDAGFLPHFPHTYPSDVNEKLQVTGIACQDYNCNKIFHAFFWSMATKWIDLGTLPNGQYSEGIWINDAGVVAGVSTSPSYPNGVTVLWDTSRHIHPLGTLPGGDASSPGFINDSGVVLGQSTVPGGDNHAYIWTATTGMQDLNNMIPPNSGWVLHHAASIDNTGHIVGYGQLNGVDHGFLLTP